MSKPMTTAQRLKRQAQKLDWRDSRSRGSTYLYLVSPPRRALRRTRPSLSNERWATVIVIGLAAAVLWEVTTGQAEQVMKSFRLP